MSFKNQSNTLSKLLEYEQSFLETEKKLLEEKKNLEKRKLIAEEKLNQQTRQESPTKLLNLLQENREIAESLVDESYIYSIEKEIQNESAKIASLKALIENNQPIQRTEITYDTSDFEAQDQIDLVCESIKNRQQELKREKLEIKRLEKTNQGVRDEIEKEYKMKLDKIQKLRKIIEKLKQNADEEHKQQEIIDDLKAKLDELKKQKQELQIKYRDDELRMPLLDSLKQDIIKLRETLSEKENTLRSEEKFYNQVKYDIDSLKNQVARKEATLEANEKDITRMEQKVTESGNNFQNVLRKMKASDETDVLTYSPIHKFDSKRPSAIETNSFSSTEISSSNITVTKTQASASVDSPFDELASLFQ